MIFIEPNSERWLDLKDLPEEEWKDVKGFESFYKISNYGRVKSFYKNIILKAGKNTDHRYIVILCKNSKKFTKKVHRLVAEAFIPNIENKLEVNHINPITKNLCDNRVCNLEWVTRKENCQWAVKLGNNKKPPVHFGHENNNAHSVIQYDMNGNYIKKWECIADICRFYDIDRHYITNCCQNKSKSYIGYIWKYNDEKEVV